MGSFIPQRPLHEFQIDLIYLENKQLNKGQKYGLVCVDCFTKVVDIELMKTKTANNTVEAMQKILNKMGIPEMIYCDEGSEFNNKQFKKLCDDNKIELILTLVHAPMVERVNRTIKQMLYRYLESTKSKTITEVLPNILNAYNTSYHNTIKMSPTDARDPKNHSTVLKNIVSKARVVNRPVLEVGDEVRVKIKNKAFDKKYKSQFSKGVHTIQSKIGRYFIVSGLDKKFLRAFLFPVYAVEENMNEPEFEGSNEQHLRFLSKNKPERVNVPLDVEQSIAKTKPKRYWRLGKCFRLGAVV